MSAVAPLITDDSTTGTVPGYLDELSDLYLWDMQDAALSVRVSWCNLGSAKTVRLEDTPLSEWAMGFLAAIREQHPVGDDDFAIEFDGLRFRGHRDQRTVGGPLLAMRKQTMQAPSLDDLLLPPWWKALMLQQRLFKEGGLILMAAALGCGKSTTIAALIRSRLEMFGGHARTVEDPAELPLDGFWGEGVCVQSTIDPNLQADHAWEHALRGMLRAFPASGGGQILFIGEIRDAEVAAAAVKAACNGQLVITTIHASSVFTAIKRLTAFAAKSMGHEVARDMTASALRLVFTQGLRPNPDPRATGWHRRIIDGSVLASTGEQHPVAVAIRENKLELLQQPFSRQIALMRNADTKRPVDDWLNESAKA